MIYLIKLATTAERRPAADPQAPVAGRRYTLTTTFSAPAGSVAIAIAVSKARSKSSVVISAGSVAPFAASASASPVIGIAALFADSASSFADSAVSKGEDGVDVFDHFHDRARYAGPCASMRTRRRPKPC